MQKNLLVKFLFISFALLFLRWSLASFILYFIPSYTWSVESQQFGITVLPNFYTGKIIDVTPQFLWNKWDTVSYLDIAINGYEIAPFSLDTFHNWAFFPLYSITIKFVSLVFFLYMYEHFLILGVFMSAIYFGLGIYFLDRLLDENLLFDKSARFHVLALLVTFPSSYFFSLAYTESLFFMLLTISLWLLFRKQFFLSSIITGLLCLTRIQGVLLVPAFLLYFLLASNYSVFKKLLLATLYSAFVFLILGSFFFYMHMITGNFLASLDAHKYLHNGFLYPFAFFTNYFSYYAQDYSYFFNAHSLVVLILISFWGVFLYAFYSIMRDFTHTRNFKHVEWALMSYFGLYLFFISGLTLGSSIPRFLLVCVPFYVFLVQSIDVKKHAQLYTCIFCVQTVLQTLFYILFLVNVPAYGF